MKISKKHVYCIWFAISENANVYICKEASSTYNNSQQHDIKPMTAVFVCNGGYFANYLVTSVAAVVVIVVVRQSHIQLLHHTPDDRDLIPLLFATALGCQSVFSLSSNSNQSLT